PHQHGAPPRLATRSGGVARRASRRSGALQALWPIPRRDAECRQLALASFQRDIARSEPNKGGSLAAMRRHSGVCSSAAAATPALAGLQARPEAGTFVRALRGDIAGDAAASTRLPETFS